MQPYAACFTAIRGAGQGFRARWESCELGEVRGSPSLRVPCTCGLFFTTRGKHIVCLALSSVEPGAVLQLRRRRFHAGSWWHQAAARSGPPSTTTPRSSPSPRPHRPAGFSVGRGAREQVLTAPTRTRRSAAAPRSRAHCTDGTRAQCQPPHTAQSRRRCQGAGPGAADRAPMPSRTPGTVLGRSCPRCAGTAPACLERGRSPSSTRWGAYCP